MQKRIVQYVKSTQDAVAAFSTPQKIIAAIGVALLAMGALFFVRWASTPTMVPLYTDLAASDAAAVVEQLNTQGVPYELTAGGSTILVPQAQVYETRLDMSAQGLPSDSKEGYSLLDEGSIGSSQFQQQVNLQRALEGELARTISSLDGVNAAVVHLAIPAKDVFLDDTKEPTASVLVSTAAGKSMTGEQVQSVVHLVSSSIESMNPESVTVVDEKGQLLSAAGAGAAGMADQREAEAAASKRMKIQAILDKIAGPGNAVATVDLELDEARSTSVSEEWKQENPALPPINRSTDTETFTGDGGAQTGVLGTENIGVPGGVAGVGDSEYTKENETVNNPVDKVTTQRESAGGELVRQSVSVVVDTEAAAGVNLDTLREAVATAAGINAARGDLLSVNQMPFDETAAAEAQAALEAAAEAEERKQLFDLIRTGLIALAILILAIVAFIISRRRKEEEEEEEYFEEEIFEEPEAVEAVPAQRTVERPVIDQSPVRMPEIDGPDPVMQAMRDDVIDMVEKQPEEVAELLRGWLADRRS